MKQSHNIFPHNIFQAHLIKTIISYSYMSFSCSNAIRTGSIKFSVTEKEQRKRKPWRLAFSMFLPCCATWPQLLLCYFNPINPTKVAVLSSAIHPTAYCDKALFWTIGRKGLSHRGCFPTSLQLLLTFWTWMNHVIHSTIPHLISIHSERYFGFGQFTGCAFRFLFKIR